MFHVHRSTSIKSRIATGVLSLAAFSVAGCTPAMKNFSPGNIWHNLQPHRLQRLNQGTGMSSDAYFSVSDPIPGLEQGNEPATAVQPASLERADY